MLEDVWVERFDILEQRIIALRDSCRAAAPFSRQAVFPNLVDCFRNFAAAQFDFFWRGFNEERLVPSESYPPEYVLAVILEQIGFDFEALQWAINQRQAGTPMMLEVLDIADRLAYEALKPAQRRFFNSEMSGKTQNISIITYFQKFAEIRMIPYASVALIGIPFTCVPPAYSHAQPVIRDYLAIPHEVAHFVYWRGKVGGRPLSHHLADKVDGQLAWGQNWIEEVFADVYGCLVGGPVMARTFQDLQLSYSQEQFVRDDDEHPSPILRPDIYTKVVQKAFDSRWAERLNGTWVEKRENRDEKDAASGERKRQFLLAGESQPRPIADAVSLIDSQDSSLIDVRLDKPLDKMINAVLAILEDNNLKWNDNWWRGYFDVATAVDDPYNLFHAHFTNGGFEAIPEPLDLIDCTPVEALHQQWLARGRQLFLAEASNKRGITLKEAQQELAGYDNQDQVPAPVWLPVLIADGWATKGPRANPVSG